MFDSSSIKRHLEGTFLRPDLDDRAKLGSGAPQLLLLAVREWLEGGVGRDEGVVVPAGQLHPLPHLVAIQIVRGFP